MTGEVAFGILLAHLVGDYLIQSGDVAPDLPSDNAPDEGLGNAVLDSQGSLRNAAVEVSPPNLAHLSGRDVRASVVFASCDGLRIAARPMVIPAWNQFRAHSRPVSAPRHNVSRVLACCPWPKMRRVAARRVVAGVAKQGGFQGDRADAEFVGEAMRPPGCALTSAPTVEKAVPARHGGPAPGPTRLRAAALIDLAPEQLDVARSQFKSIHALYGSQSVGA